MTTTNNQNEIKKFKAGLKIDVVRMRANLEYIKNIEANPLSKKYASSILKITIHLHNFNIVEVRKEEIKFNRIMSDMLNEFLFSETPPPCQIRPNKYEKNNYSGSAENESENARQIGEAQKRNAENINQVCSIICNFQK